MGRLNPTGTPAPFLWQVRAYYEDTDASGVVYHAVYLKYFERARTEWLRALGFSQQQLRERLAVVFTVANIEVDYLRPARLDDELVVAVHVAEVRRASLNFEQVLTRRADVAVLARARVRVGCVEVDTFKPCALPGAFARKLETGVSV